MMCNEKPHISDALAGDEIMGLNSTCSNEHANRITRLALLKQRSNMQSDYLFQAMHDCDDLKEAENMFTLANRLRGCSSYLLFRDYYTIEQKKLHKKNSCFLHLMCPSCSALRASKMIKNIMAKCEQVLQEKPKLIPAMLTLTVKNGDDLEERFNHLMNAFKKLLNRYRGYNRGGRGFIFNEFCKIDGAFYTVEFTFNHKTNEWHPHIHMFALLNDYIDHSKLSELWQDVTGDSFVVGIKKAYSKNKKQNDSLVSAVVEVCKYALKFGDLTPEKTWQAYQILKGKRLSGCFGSLRGVKEPDKLTDDLADTNDLPYNELHYNFVYGKKSYYNLMSVRHIDKVATTDVAISEYERITARSHRLAIDGGKSDYERFERANE